jgi:hypothetical protein
MDAFSSRVSLARITLCVESIQAIGWDIFIEGFFVKRRITYFVVLYEWPVTAKENDLAPNFSVQFQCT